MAAREAEHEAALGAQRVQTAGRLQVIEERVRDATQKVDEATAAQTRAETEVARHSQSLSAMLPLALRLSLYPSETVLAASAPPEQAVEGLTVAQGFSANLAYEVVALRAEKERARMLADAAARRRFALDVERKRLAMATSSLDRQITQADEAQARALDEAAMAAQAAAVLAARAEDLRGAIAAMDAAERRAAVQEAARVAQTAHGPKRKGLAYSAWAKQALLGTPAGPGLNASTPRVILVTGRIIRQWGTPAEDGPATGLTYSAAPGALVVSPCAGRVAFAAPFRNYGRLMIIECGAQFDFVLAGMDRLDASVGRAVKAGEPVGRMAVGAAAAGQSTLLLYIELRKNGLAVDPLPYLNGKP